MDVRVSKLDVSTPVVLEKDLFFIADNDLLTELVGGRYFILNISLRVGKFAHVPLNLTSLAASTHGRSGI